MGSERPKKLPKVEELCRIIAVCGEAGVAELKFGDLSISFGKKTERVGPDPRFGHLFSMETASSPKTAAEIAELQAKIAESALEDDEVAFRERQISELFITDPLKAEELLAQGELIDDGEEDADEGT